MHIASKDRVTELTVLLHSLLSQEFQDFDVVILDDGYGKPIKHNFKFLHDVIGRLRITGHGVFLLRNDVSYGVCNARKKLLEDDPWKDNELVLRVDDDTVCDKHFLGRLVDCFSDDSVGIVSGITPGFGGPDVLRDCEMLGGVVNRMIVNEEGKIEKYADDCGVLYDTSKSENVVLPAHNFRSNALIRRSLHDSISYEEGLSPVCFREEAFLSLRALMNKWKIVVNLDAINWHAHCMSGGCRHPNYASLVASDQACFERFVKDNKDKLREVLVCD